MFFSKEDREMPGTFIRALARQYDADTFLPRYTDSRGNVFEATAKDGRLPGAVAPDRAGRSTSVAHARQRVILQRRHNAGVDFIIEHRFELLALGEPLVLSRLRRRAQLQTGARRARCRRWSIDRPAPPAASSP
jgi:hypothetical protein